MEHNDQALQPSARRRRHAQPTEAIAEVSADITATGVPEELQAESAPAVPHRTRRHAAERYAEQPDATIDAQQIQKRTNDPLIVHEASDDPDAEMPTPRRRHNHIPHNNETDAELVPAQVPQPEEVPEIAVASTIPDASDEVMEQVVQEVETEPEPADEAGNDTKQNTVEESDQQEKLSFDYPTPLTVKKQESPKKDKQKKSSQKPAPEQEEGSDKRSGKSLKRVAYRLAILLCSVVLVSSSAMLLKYFTQIHRANKASSELRELYQDGGSTTTVATQTAQVTSTPTLLPSQTVRPTATPVPNAANSAAAFRAMWPTRYPGNEQMRIQEQFGPLRHQNKDIVGWLRIEGVLDEPVFQRDNNYYLTHDATGASNPTGALFLDEKCNLRTVPMQVLIHGHNMKEGAMFGSLKKYKVKDASFYRAHPYIQFNSLYENATYVIFSVAEVNIVAGNTHYFPFWHQFSFDDYDSFHRYVSLAKEYSRFRINIDVRPGDRLLTLATCSSEDDDLRLIVMARMLREDEDTILLSNQIYSATAK